MYNFFDLLYPFSSDNSLARAKHLTCSVEACVKYHQIFKHFVEFKRQQT